MCNFKEIGWLFVFTLAAFVGEIGFCTTSHAQWQVLFEGLAPDAALTVARGAASAELATSGLSAAIESGEAEVGAGAARTARGAERTNTRVGVRVGLHADHSEGHSLEMAMPPGPHGGGNAGSNVDVQQQTCAPGNYRNGAFCFPFDGGFHFNTGSQPTPHPVPYSQRDEGYLVITPNPLYRTRMIPYQITCPVGSSLGWNGHQYLCYRQVVTYTCPAGFPVRRADGRCYRD